MSYLSCFFISFSIAAFCVSTLPGIRTEGTIMGSPYWLKLLELVCSSFFTLEFLMRLVFCPTKLLFFKRPMNWIDLISILPFYVSQVSDDDKVKMFLVIRVLRLFRYVMVIKKENRSIIPSLYRAKLFQKWFNSSLGLKDNLAESYESKEKKRSVGVDWFIAARAYPGFFSGMKRFRSIFTPRP